MNGLNLQKENTLCKIVALQGSNKFISKITAMGLTNGTIVEVIQNNKKFPVLLFARDTMIAVNKEEAKKILVKEVS
ncbi:MAG: ferrous iron transport protein A [Anaeromicrobium sp.]|jgi:ferrous iron transport protein A|uniref:FeoA family protein n=1 Tax=Anaeromicrobium sp. TaxID=1929132 RepID=UPI0025EC48D2|nr:FeoA family protein [Anaeromicrobium sp.]MCT4596140.1 ferrous iron transport protein A [Anaeromicrobium sp.]